MNTGIFIRPAAIATTLLVAASLAGCGDGKDKSKKVDVNSQGLDVSGCKPADPPKPKSVDLPAPTKRLDPSKTHKVTFKTNCGDFTVKLEVKKSPKTSASVAYLVENGVYDNTWFHRIIRFNIVQGGDPSGNGKGDAGYKVVERPRGAYEIGTMAMAKAGNEAIGTSGSQFFIVAGQSGTMLNIDYAIAGSVVDGEDTIERIGSYGPPGGDQSGKPISAAVISKAIYEESN